MTLSDKLKVLGLATRYTGVVTMLQDASASEDVQDLANAYAHAITVGKEAERLLAPLMRESLLGEEH